MAVTDAPAVTFDGVTLASSWSLTQRIALGGLAITWGRATHLEPAEPASLKLEVLDTDGQIASSADIIGKRVTVVRADGRTIFRGRVDDFEIDRVEMNDPKVNITRRVWRLMIVAYDTVAELAKAHPAGPGNEPFAMAGLGPGYWPLERPQGRIDDIKEALTGIVSDIQWADPYPLGEDTGLWYQPRADDVSALNLVEDVYSAVPLGYVRHDPHTNALTIGQPASTDGVELTWDGDTLDVALVDGMTIPARTIAMPSGYKASTGAADAIDVLQIVSTRRPRATEMTGVEVVTERVTSRYDWTASGRREHRITTGIMYSLDQQTTSVFEWPFPLQYVTSEFGFRDTGFHYGIDFSGGPAVSEAPIPSAGAGTVVASVEGHPGWGNYVDVDHGADGGGNTLLTRYAHMIAPGVPVGTVVELGDTLGHVGNTGNSFGAHLHLETRVNGEAINPRIFMDRYGTGQTNPGEEGLWQEQLADDTVALLNQLNGKVNLPRIRLDWRILPYAPAVASTFLDAVAKPVALYFPGSVFAPVYEAATEHQIIGGTLVYHRGWTLDATLAPATRSRAGITINELVTIDAPLLSDFDDDLSIADIGNVTKGVTA